MKHSRICCDEWFQRNSGTFRGDNLMPPRIAAPEGTEHMIKTIMTTGLALALVAGTTIATAPSAEAGRGGRTAGIVAGTVIGLGVLGAYAASRDRAYYRSCYPGRQRCDVVGQRCWYSRYGEYVCKDDVRCYRPTVCD